MVTKTLFLQLLFVTLFFQKLDAQCTITATVSDDTIARGECVQLSATSTVTGLLFSEDFNTGAPNPTGWAFTQQALFTNPCDRGVDSTTHLWMGNTSADPRSLVTNPVNYSSMPSVQICFDLLFGVQGNIAPCEGPDAPEEGVYLQYSIDGTNWVTIHHFDPNGGNDPLLTTWNNWCYSLPDSALAPNVSIRWFQSVGSGPDYDHWGIDNIFIGSPNPVYQIAWQHDGYIYPSGSTGGVHPDSACPTVTRTYTVEMTNGFFDCNSTVRVVVEEPNGINDIAERNEISISPNPVHDAVRIKHTKHETIAEIVEMSGKTLRTFQLSADSNTSQLDASGLPVGVYFIRVTGGKQVRYGKFYKE